MDFSVKAATKGRRLSQAPPVLHATAPHLDSTQPTFLIFTSRANCGNGQMSASGSA